MDTDRADAPDVSAWPGVVITEALTGGARARVWAAHRGEEPLVVKVSPREGPSLDWELGLLTALTGAGVSVPTPTPTADGRLRAGRVFVSRFLPGGPPGTAEQWRAAAEVDSPLFDLAALATAAGGAVAVPDSLDRQVLADAALAWEVATCWVPEPGYARRCLRRLRGQRGRLATR